METSEDYNMKKIFCIFIFMLIFPNYVFGESRYGIYTPQNLKNIESTNSQEKILFIVDFSNSMNEYLEGEKKIETAIRVLSSIISRLNPEIYTGLRVYGHRGAFNSLLGCTASDLVTPILPKNNKNIMNSISNVKATGWTPITYSLKKAVNNDFAGIQGQKRIILLTDGGENCDESPCEYALKLISERDDIKIDVIAFAINDEDADKQLKCTALATYGKFYKANTSAALMNSLEQSLNITKDVQGVIIKK